MVEDIGFDELLVLPLPYTGPIAAECIRVQYPILSPPTLFKLVQTSDRIMAIFLCILFLKMNETKTKMNTDNFLDVSDTVYIAVDILINCFLSQFLACLGLVGNVLNICVLSQQGMKDTTNLLLLYLAVSDLIFSLFSVLY
uniref:G-protein coupled receptors family 1 profile domain-containing protein n=1 Tax=Biomphalaria glabrata TaxID=6526 RepID=A0A2C9LHG5_BIOGL